MPTVPSISRRARWGRPLAVTAAVVFLISSAFPFVAGLAHDTAAFPQWWGTLDVALAFVLAILAFALLGLTHGRVNKQADDAAYRAYRTLIHGIMVMLVVFVFCGDRIVWSNCLSGFAWRTWLLLYLMPAWFAALQGGTGGRQVPASQ